jgi:hypothetical protein
MGIKKGFDIKQFLLTAKWGFCRATWGNLRDLKYNEPKWVIQPYSTNFSEEDRGGSTNGHSRS